MVRLKHIASGAVVQVTEEKAERLGSEWSPVDEAKKAPAKKAASRKSES